VMIDDDPVGSPCPGGHGGLNPGLPYSLLHLAQASFRDQV
jgi:hypothetical protein